MPDLISVEQQIKDAAKIITNPPLIYSAQKSDSSLFFDFDNKTTNHFKTLLQQQFTKAYDYSKHYRLGIYFEYLLEQVFRAKKLKLLKQHEVLSTKDRTLGELDFLIDLPKTGITHLEVAFKVYAFTGIDWRGPNPTDSLTTKIAHLFDKQLKMYQRFEAHWHEAEIPVPDSFQALVQGRLFLPFRQNLESSITSIKTATLQFEINLAAVNSGIWCHKKDFANYAEQYGIEYWQSLDKPYWITGLSTNDYWHFSQIDSLIAAHQSAILKPVIIDSMEDKLIKNLVLILPNDWPKLR